MPYINHKLLGVSLITLAFSTSTAIAQTCTVPPDCTTLGFTQTSEACKGKTTLKCPFDQSKVYCPSDNEMAKTYGIGDTYVDAKGVAVGKVISVTDCENGSSSNSFLYGDPMQCLGVSTHDYKSDYDAMGNQIFTHPASAFTCMYGRFYQINGTYRYGFMRISGGGNGKCRHGTISSPVVRYGTLDEASKGCMDLTSGGLSWYLPSTYNGYYFGYGTGSASTPYLQGLWAVAGDCLYNGRFGAMGSPDYQSNCQTCISDKDYNLICTDKKMSYYCIAMF